MNEAELKSFLDAVRATCSADLWSKAVQLWRAQVVTGLSEFDGELLLRVKSGEGIISPTVRLTPGDEDWSCNCTDPSSTCVHVAAAVIALRQAQQSGKSLFGPKAAMGKIGCRFTRVPGGIAFHRVAVFDDREVRFDATIPALMNGSVPGPRISPDHDDLAVEAALGSRSFGLLPRHTLIALLDALQTCRDLRLDGKPVRPAPRGSPIHAKLETCAGGWRMQLEQDPSITEVFANGAVLCGDSLRAIGESALTQRELDDLRPGRLFRTHELPELLTEVLPSLETRIPVRILATDLPALVADVFPRLVLETRRDDDALSVLALLVYGDPPIARVDGDRLTHLRGPVPVRRKEAEQRLARLLEDRLGLAPGVRGRCKGEEAIALVQRIQELGTRELEVQGKAHRAFFRAPAIVPMVRVDGGSFDVAFESRDDTGKVTGSASPAAMMAAWQRGESMVPLLDGGLAPIPADWMAKFGQRVADLLAAKNVTRGELPAYAVPDLAALCIELGEPPPPSFDRMRLLLEGTGRLPESSLPEDLQATLRDYQRAGVNWLCFLRDAGLGAMLADDMGLGKTLQAMCAMRGRTLVVAPTSVLHNWACEIRRFRPSQTVRVYHGPGRTLEGDATVTLTTYALLRLDAEILAAQAWDTVILDEAQAIKNPDSQAAKTSYRLQAGFRMTLSGTPVENRLEELWSQMHFLNRGLLGSRKDFQTRVARPIVEGIAGSAARLRGRIRPFVLRRLKSEVAKELPPRTEVVLRCALSQEERNAYDAVRAAMVPGVVEKLATGGNVLAALEALLRLRQACCHTGLLPGQSAASSSKIDTLIEELDEAVEAGHKALVFSQWTSMLDLVEPHLKAAGIGFTRLDGSTADRGAVVAGFQGSDGPPVMLVSLKAGGTGLNLTAADHVYLMDPWWNPAVEDQAADRTHRIGQDRPVMIHRLIAEATIEERILELQQAKRSLQAAALDGADAALSLTKDDLLNVLGDA